MRFINKAVVVGQLCYVICSVDVTQVSSKIFYIKEHLASNKSRKCINSIGHRHS